MRAPKEQLVGVIVKRALERADLATTIVFDAIVLIIVFIVRFCLLWTYARFKAPGSSDVVVRILEFVMDFGIVGTATVIVVFDLLKRAVIALNQLRKGSDE